MENLGAMCLAWKPECTEAFCKGFPDADSAGCAVVVPEAATSLVLARMGGQDPSDKTMCAMIDNDRVVGKGPLCTVEAMREFSITRFNCLHPEGGMACDPQVERMIGECPEGERLVLEDDGTLRCAEMAARRVEVHISVSGEHGQ